MTTLNGQETLYVNGALANGMPSGSVFQTTTGAIAALGGGDGIGIYNFGDWDGAVSNTDVIVALQDFLLNCQLQYYALRANDVTLDDQVQRNCVVAYIPAGKWYHSCPLIIPEHVRLVCDGLLVRKGNGTTTETTFYDGNTSSNACAQLFHPAIIGVFGSILDRVNGYGNSNGSDKGSGIFCGKNWTSTAITVALGGQDYQAGDTCQLAQPSKKPYEALQFTVESVDGNGGILTWSITNNGAYALPPVLQAQQWTAANGFTGAVANGTIGSVFDANGNFLVTGGSGSGASFAITWQADWLSGNSLYQSGSSQTLIGDMALGWINYVGCGTSFSSTYGSIYAFWPAQLNYDIDMVQVGGGNIGINLRGTGDVRANLLNAVDAETGLVVFAVGSVHCPDVVIDTVTNTFYTIDDSNGVTLKIHCLQSPSTPGALSEGFCGIVGGSSACSTVDLHVTYDGVGTSAGVPALSVQNVKGCHFYQLISEYQRDGTASPNLINAYCTFGSNVDASNAFEGQIDGVTGAIFNGAIPNCGIHVEDASAQGVALRNGTYELYGSGAPTNGTTGVNKAGKGSRYIDYANGNLYMNTGAAASPSWSELT